MIKYEYLPGQLDSAIFIAEDIFSRMKERGIQSLPTFSKDTTVVLFHSNSDDSDEFYIYFVSGEDNIGYFISVEFCVHGASKEYSAKFHYENIDES